MDDQVAQGELAAAIEGLTQRLDEEKAENVTATAAEAMLRAAMSGVRQECLELCAKVQREQSDLKVEECPPPHLLLATQRLTRSVRGKVYDSQRQGEEEVAQLQGELSRLQDRLEDVPQITGGRPGPRGGSQSLDATSPSVDTANGELSLVSLKAYVDEQLAASAEDMAAVAEDVLEAHRDPALSDPTPLIPR